MPTNRTGRGGRECGLMGVFVLDGLTDDIAGGYLTEEDRDEGVLDRDACCFLGVVGDSLP